MSSQPAKPGPNHSDEPMSHDQRNSEDGIRETGATQVAVTDQTVAEKIACP